ncbi:MAG: DUF1415 domain-containing protein [Aureispira sp.]
MATTLSPIQQTTKKWLEKIVIGFNFCPFARRIWLQNKVLYQVCPTTDVAAILQAFIKACQELEEQDEIETTLLIVPEGLEEFETYLGVVEMAENLLEEMGYTGVYQVASFHPDYVFGGSTPQDPSNYTNRSPYPMLHLLREESIERALEHYEDPEGIPERNIALANSKTLATWKNLLAACFNPTK